MNTEILDPIETLRAELAADLALSDEERQAYLDSALDAEWERKDGTRLQLDLTLRIDRITLGYLMYIAVQSNDREALDALTADALSAARTQVKTLTALETALLRAAPSLFASKVVDSLITTYTWESEEVP